MVELHKLELFAIILQLYWGIESLNIYSHAPKSIGILKSTISTLLQHAVNTTIKQWEPIETVHVIIAIAL